MHVSERKIDIIELVPENGIGYAIFQIDTTKQSLSILSDHGSFAYDLWHRSKDEDNLEFYRFLCSINRHYVYDKLSYNRENDVCRDTLKIWFRQLVEDRKEGWLNKEEARKVWECLTSAYDSHWNNPDLLSHEIYMTKEITKKYDEPWYSFPVEKVSRALLDLLDKYWDEFIKAISKKLENK